MKLLARKQKKQRNSLIVLSLLIIILDISFVAINYNSARNALHQSLTEKAHSRRSDFQIMIQMVYRNMRQMSEQFSHDDKLNQLFLAGKKGLEAGGTAGVDTAQKARQNLLAQLQPIWGNLMEKFAVRQLHYHLGPGSLSFLRVHRPDKFGDRMDDLRHTIVDTNAEKTGRTGFETGRVYSGLRVVSPIWTNDPQTGLRTYVGALEVGTSFKQILPLFSQSYGVEAAVFLTKNHVESKMWPDFVFRQFEITTFADYYLEASSLQEATQSLKSLLPLIKISPELKIDDAQLVELLEKQYMAFYFPLRDYQGEINKELPPAGFILLWEDISDQVKAFHFSIWINIIYALIGFIIVETVLLWIFRQEFRLQEVQYESTIDSLTGVFNRRYFDKAIKHDLLHANRSKGSLSLIVCDIDFFKKYNDSYGHSKGDRCLKIVSKELNESLSRDSDWIARYGGEEFAIVLPGTNLEGAIMVAERICSAVENLRIPHKGSEISRWVTISAGVASSNDSSDPAELFNIADQCLYRAKKNGRNRAETCEQEKY